MPQTKKSWVTIVVAIVIAAGGGARWILDTNGTDETETITIGSFNSRGDLGLGYEDRRALLGHKAASRITADYTHVNVNLLREYIDKH